MKMLARLGLLSVVILSVPTSVMAGGGGAGSKSKVNIRVKNVGVASADVPLVGIETVEVGDPGNYPTAVGGESRGFVAQTFRMAKYEVTIGDYVTFLNTVAKRGDGSNAAVVESLYDSRMSSDANVAGITRSGSGTEASPYVYSTDGDPKRPIAYVDFFSAARFANWMHNGATATASIESGAYSLAGGFSEYVHRAPGAKWWIPSHDEWFKAAYFKGGPVDAGYWMFPTKSDTLPANSPSTGTSVANFLNVVYAVTGSASLVAAQNYLTAVGTFENAPGPYGTFDQGGNVEEWTDEVVYSGFGAARVTRGGAWNSGGLNDDVDPLPTALPTDRSSKIGFRLARLATDLGIPGATSRNVTVAVGATAPSGGGRSVPPGQVIQFKVNKGAFVVAVSDVTSPSVASTQAFKTGTKKTVYIEVSSDGTTVATAESNTRF